MSKKLIEITSEAMPQTGKSEMNFVQLCKGCWDIGMMEEWNL